MKTKIISVLLCVCMLAGVMSIAGLAAAVNTTTNVQIYIKNPLEISKSKTVPDILDEFSTYLKVYGSDYNTLKEYYKFLPSVVGGKLHIEITEKSANRESTNPSDPRIYRIINDDVERGTLDTLSIEQTITWTSQLFDLQMGVRKYDKSGGNLVSTNIAKVTATYKGNISVQDTIYNLQYGDTVNLVAELYNDYADYYQFYCWVDGSNNVKSEEPGILVTIKESASIFAVFREIANRRVVTYNASKGGKIIFNETENLKIFEGEGQVSVFEGSSPKATFVPDEGYEVSKVVVNEDGTPKEVSSIKSLLSALFNASDFDDALSIFGTYTDATNKDVYSYTIKNIAADATISVTFIKSKVYEPASGVEYVPGPELSTDAADEADADGDGAGATTLPAENGGSSNADVVNPQTGSTTAIAAFATLSLAAAAAFVTAKKKRS